MRRSTWALALSAFLVASSSVSAGAVAPGSGYPQWPATADWQSYVEAPKTSDVDPARIVSTSGSVSGAQALTEPGQGGVTVLKMVAGGPRPTIVVDYGKDVGGVPYFVVRSESKSPVLRATFSEGLNYLGREGDNSPSLSDAGDSARADNLIVSSPGELSTDLIQGGERYERISLISPGTVTLSSIGIRFTAVRATAKDYKGWFDSSSNQLDRIWYDGAYTMQLDELPADAVPGPWNVINGVLNGTSGSSGLIRSGIGWTNYTMSFDAQPAGGEVGWLVRASSSLSGYLFLLAGSADRTGSQARCVRLRSVPSRPPPSRQFPFPGPSMRRPGTRCSTDVSGTEITTSIDGHQVASFDTDSLPAGAPVYGSGSVGFLFWAALPTSGTWTSPL